MNSPPNKPLKLKKDRLRNLLGKVVNYTWSQVDSIVNQQTPIENIIQIKKLSLPLPLLGENFSGYRILHISDLHLGTWLKPYMLQPIAEIINNLSPHLIVISGDLVSSTTTHFLPYYKPFLSQLNSADGIIIVRGNHDCYAKKSDFINSIKVEHVVYLENKIYNIHRAEQTLTIAGLDSIYYHQDDIAIVRALVGSKKAAILVVHEPDIAEISSSGSWFGLQLSGHSHGGQIVLPIIGAPWLPKYGKKFPCGLYKINDMLLFVNNGLGTSSAHLRIGSMAEMVVLELYPAELPTQAHSIYRHT